MARVLTVIGLVGVAVQAGAGPWVTARADQDPIGPGLAVRSVAGTTWVGEDVCGPQSYRFEPGGVLVYAYRDAHGQLREYRNATWSQRGAFLKIETNGGHAERRGTLWGDRIEGEGWNLDGQRWRWQAQRQRGSRPPLPAPPKAD